MKLKSFTLMFVLAVIFSGCAKEVAEYNKSAMYWYEKMNDAVASGSLEKADGYYSSLQSEHIGSPLLKEATIIMAQAHMQAGEYILAEHFLNEYIHRFADDSQREFASYLKVRAKFLSLPNPRRDQTLIKEALAESEAFKAKYKFSNYLPAINTMLVKLYLARANLNQTIASLYGRIDKPKAQAYYLQKESEKWINWDEVNPPEIPWYKEMYEGDGTASWYASWLPESKSIIARDANGDEK